MHYKTACMLDILRKEGGKVAFKNESLLMKIIGLLMFFNRRFMTDYVTTIGTTVYLPSRAVLLSDTMYIVLGHELVHVLDYKKEGKKFYFKYLWPHILYIPLAVIFSTILLFSAAGKGMEAWYVHAAASLLLAFLYLRPQYAVYREAYEAKAYAVTLLLQYIAAQNRPMVELRHQDIQVPDNIAYQFTGPAYYYMSGRMTLYKDIILSCCKSYIWYKQNHDLAFREYYLGCFGFSVDDILSVAHGTYVLPEECNVDVNNK